MEPHQSPKAEMKSNLLVKAEPTSLARAEARILVYMEDIRLLEFWWRKNYRKSRLKIAGEGESEVELGTDLGFAATALPGLTHYTRDKLDTSKLLSTDEPT